MTSIVRQTPSGATTNADELTWRVTFSEAVANVDAADFRITVYNGCLDRDGGYGYVWDDL